MMEQERARARPTAPGGVPRWLTWSVGASWRLIVIAAALWLLGQVLVRLRLVVVPVVVALFVATALAPPADWLRRKGVPALAATWIVVLAVVAGFGGLGLVVGPRFVDQLGELGALLSEALDNIREWLQTGPLGLSSERTDQLVESVRETFRENQGVITRGVFAGAVVVIEVIAGLLLTITLTFFFIKDGERITSWFLGLFSERRARDLKEIGRRVSGTIGGYFRGLVVVGAVNGAFIGIALAILGVPLVFPLALLTFFGAFFPIVGAVVAGTVAALVALASEGLTAALIVVAVTLVVQQIEGDVLAPVLIGKSLRLHPVVILLALTAGGVVGGIFGAFVAVPFVGSVAASLDYLRHRDGGGDAGDGGVAIDAGAEPG